MKRKRTKSSGSSNGGSGEVKKIAIEKTTLHPTFVSLLPISEDLQERTSADMRVHGFYPSEPVTLGTWPGLKEPVLIDGHMRIRAALQAGITHVPYVLLEFESELAALDHAINLQAKRRDNTDVEHYRLCELRDKVKARGGDRRSKAAQSKVQHGASDSGQHKSAKEIARLIGCHFRTVEKIRKIRKDGTEEIQRAVRTGKMRINRAFNLIRDMEKGKDPRKSNSSATFKAAKIIISEKNLAMLKKLGGDPGDHVNKALEVYECWLADNGAYSFDNSNTAENEPAL